MGGRARTLVGAAVLGLLGLGAALLVLRRADGDAASGHALRTAAASSSTDAVRAAQPRESGPKGRRARAGSEGPRRPKGRTASPGDGAAGANGSGSMDGLVLEPPDPEPGMPAWDERWLSAWQADARRYGPAELQRIEDLYRSGGDDFDSVEGREALADLVEQYPDSNRAGCAAMNLGGAYLEEGDLDEAQYWLEEVISSESGAVFGNGEAVLAKALFHYGALWQARGDLGRARQAWERLRDELGGETDSHGTPYGDLVDELLEPPE